MFNLIAEFIGMLALMVYSSSLYSEIRRYGFEKVGFLPFSFAVLGIVGIFVTPIPFHGLIGFWWNDEAVETWSVRTMQFVLFWLPMFAIWTARIVVWFEDRPLAW
ncbi:MAG: hypothetical protein WDN47_03125 [Candidatus Doudnabacteria bacterium]